MSNEANTIEETLKKSITPNHMAGLAKSEIKQRTQGMDEKEMQIIVKNIPSNVLWDELRKRFDVKSEMVRRVRAAVMVTVNDVDE